MIELISIAITLVIFVSFLIILCSITIFTILYLLYVKTSRILCSPFIIKIYLLFENQIQYLYRLLKINLQDLYLFVIAGFNKYFLNKFKHTKNRILFLPQCLRSSACKAPTTPQGIICAHCNRCSISSILRIASKFKYKTFIVTGGTMVKRIITQIKPDGVVGVGCIREVLDGLKMCYLFNIPAQGVVLLKDGCIETIVDIVELANKLKIGISHA